MSVFWQINITLTIVLLAQVCSPRVYAQPVTLADLDGVTIETTMVYEQVGRKNGTVIATRLQDDRRITVGPADTLQSSTVHTVTGPWGTKVFPTSGSGSTFTLNKPKQISGLGGGDAVWIFANGTLTFLRTYRSGGFKTEIIFRRGGSGLTCNIRSPFARENGTGAIEMTSLGGGTWELISSRVLSSSCRVTKR